MVTRKPNERQDYRSADQRAIWQVFEWDVFSAALAGFGLSLVCLLFHVAPLVVKDGAILKQFNRSVIHNKQLKDISDACLAE
jgi:hypothetical protein